jgi:predicted nucleotidyltransferase component of viral defense system
MEIPVAVTSMECRPPKFVVLVSNVLCLRYEGLLYDGTDRSRGSVELDVSTRDDVYRDPEWRRLFIPYPETRTVTVRCLGLAEAFAEKLGALSTRSLGRDLYDAWFLLRPDVPVEPELFERKMAVLDESPRVSVTTTEREYDRDLSVLLDHPPGYDDVLEAVVNAVSEAGLPVETP